jgi:hypothetical protein
MIMPESGVNHRIFHPSPQSGHVAVAAGCATSNRPAHALHRMATGRPAPAFTRLGV